MSDKHERVKISILGISSACLSLFIEVYIIYFDLSGYSSDRSWYILETLSLITAVLAIAAIIQRIIVKRQLWWLGFGGLIGPLWFLALYFCALQILTHG